MAERLVLAYNPSFDYKITLVNSKHTPSNSIVKNLAMLILKISVIQK